MQVKNVVLVMGVLIFGGCSKSFQPKNSTCDRVHQELSMLEISGDTSGYTPRELRRLENILADCEVANSLSEADYKKYKEILDDVNELDSEADKILNTTIHDTRIK